MRALWFATIFGGLALLGGGVYAEQPAGGEQAKAGAGLTQPRPLPASQMGDLMMARRRYRDAIDHYGEALERVPILWNKVGVAHHEMKELDEAALCYREALKSDGASVEATNNLGAVFYDKGDWKEAAEQFEDAARLAPESASVRANLAAALFARKKYESATDAWSQALRLDPQVLDRKQEEFALLQRRQVEESPEYHVCLGQAYGALGMTREAEFHLDKARQAGFTETRLENQGEGWILLRWLLDLFR